MKNKPLKLFSILLFLLILLNKTEGIPPEMLSNIEVSASHDTGNSITYSYDAVTGQKIAEFIGTDSKILQRRLFEYDAEKRLSAILMDNGTSLDIQDNQEVTKREGIFFTYASDDKCEPEFVEEKTFDHQSGTFITTETVTYRYDSQDNVFLEITTNGLKVLQQKHYIYDADGKLLAIEISDQSGKTDLQTFEENALEQIEPQSGKSRFFQGIWNGAKNIASSVGDALNYFKKNASYTPQLEEGYQQIAEQVFDKSYLQFAGYYSHSLDSGTTPYGEEINDKVRVTLINGILNVRYDIDVLLKLVSESHGNTPVHYVFRPTEGWTKDILSSMLSKFGYTHSYAEHLAKTWKNMIEDMGGVGQGGKIIHYAHSIGATDTYIAKNLLTPEERQMIHVIALGSPTMIPHTSGFASATNYVSKRDGVCLLDPIGYMMGYFYGNSKIEWIGSLWGIPLIDHTLYGDSYGEVIHDLGKEFTQTYQ